MNKLKKLLGVAGVVLWLLLLPVTGALSQFCQGNFDYDNNVDGSDAAIFKQNFGRSAHKNPCPPDGPSPVERTWQTLTYQIGDDGYYQMGVRWPNPRFTDNGFTITDNLTGLEWFKQLELFPAPVSWIGALDVCNHLDYAGYIDWRLPNVKELLSLIDYNNAYPALPAGHNFQNVLLSHYWTSTTGAGSTDYAAVVHTNGGQVDYDHKTNSNYVWPLRGGRSEPPTTTTTIRPEVHISYYDITNGNLKYAYWNGTNWSTAVVDPSANDVGQYTSIALDSVGNPHISYLDVTNDALNYARWNGSAWYNGTIEGVGGEGYYHSTETSIALNSTNIPYISYSAFVDDPSIHHKLAHLEVVELTWLTETIWGGFNSSMHNDTTSLVLDSNDYPHVAFGCGLTFYDVRYARWNGRGWSNDYVPDPFCGPVGCYSPSLALDSNGFPHISYNAEYDYLTGEWVLRYAHWNGINWDIETVDDTVNVGESSLALDSNGNPHISYYNATNGDLEYAYWNGSSWNKEAVDSDGSMGAYNSLALDTAGNPHISYFNATNDDLKYAHWNGSGWNKETVDSNGSVGAWTSLALEQ